MPKPNDNIERRVLKNAELRVIREAGKPTKIRGYAAVFDSDSEDFGGFTERIAKGAFTPAMGSDVRCLFNHDPNLILGRTPDTLRMWEDDKGLGFETLLPDTQTARDLMVSMERGDISQCSFAFSLADGGAEFNKDRTIRTIRTVDRLYDVSPVTYPAYPDTTVALRSLEAAKAGSATPVAEPEKPKEPPAKTEDEIRADENRARIARAEMELKKRKPLYPVNRPETE